MLKLDKSRLIFGFFLLILIVAFSLFFEHFHLPSWPAFMVMIFFIEGHMDVKKIPNIIVGGILGIFSIIVVHIFATITAGFLSHSAAVLIYVSLFVYAIVAFGETLPIVFNNYAFMFFLVAGVAAEAAMAGGAKPNPNLWISITVLLGGALVGGVLGILKLMGILFAPKEEVQAGQEA